MSFRWVGFCFQETGIWSVLIILMAIWLKMNRCMVVDNGI